MKIIEQAAESAVRQKQNVIPKGIPVGPSSRQVSAEQVVVQRECMMQRLPFIRRPLSRIAVDGSSKPLGIVGLMGRGPKSACDLVKLCQCSTELITVGEGWVSDVAAWQPRT